MSERQDSQIDGLSAPSGNGEVLIWPAGGNWRGLVESNRSLRRGYRFEIAGRMAGDWNRATETSGPVVTSGHQPEFFHPGVWAKNVAACRLAEAMGGTALFIAVDSDWVDGVRLSWPGRGFARKETAHMGIGGCAFEYLPELEDDACRFFFERVRAGAAELKLEGFDAFVAGFLSGGDREYVERWRRGMSALDRAIGTKSPRVERISGWYSIDNEPGAGLPGWAFAGHALSRGRELSTAYNGALAAYRVARGIRGRQHPIPDLVVEEERVESPYWLMRRGAGRRRAMVCVGAREVRLFAEDELVGVMDRRGLEAGDREAIGKGLGDWEIRPRALMLTMHARLFGCDLFIHGIGGAKYDQITDEIIRRWLGVEPPGMACCSATLRLKDGEGNGARMAAMARQRLRDMQFNPDRYLGAEGRAARADVALAARREAILQAMKLAVEARKNRRARREAWERIRQMNGTAFGELGEEAERLRHEVKLLEGGLGREALERSREWFCGFFPPERLSELARRIGSS